MNRAIFTVGLIVMTASLPASQVLAQLQVPPAPTYWYATNQRLNEIDAQIELDARSQHMDLYQGWTCLVGGLTAQNLNSFRDSTCTNQDKSFSFTVECGPDRKKEHVQIRFKDKNGRPVDFIEIGCELRK